MTEHYYTEKQKSEFKPKLIDIALSDIEFGLYTSGGVFSSKKLDLGTKLLIEQAIVKKGWKVLDLGCGYGVVGIAIKRLYTSSEVVLSDVNTRAIKLVRMNVKHNKIEAEVIHSDAFKNKKFDGVLFDTILLNPPQTAGKDVCFNMIEESKKHLCKGGLLQLVARTQKGGKHLSKKMEEVFGNVRETAKKSGYRIYVGENKG